MEISNNNYLQFAESINQLLTKKCWSVFRSYGSILILDFGKKIKYVSPKTGHGFRGEWTLIIQTAHWTLSKSQKTISTGESNFEEIDKTVPLLTGKIVESSIAISEKISLSFSDNLQLEIFHDQEIPALDLYLPDGKVLSWGTDNKLEISK